MRIIGFNPEFTLLIVKLANTLPKTATDKHEDDITRAVVFAFLSKRQPHNLASYLTNRFPVEGTFHAKLLTCANERTRVISQAIQELNDLCLQKANLKTTPAYLKSHEEFENLKKSYAKICKYDSENAASALDALESMTSSTISKKTRSKLNLMREEQQPNAIRLAKALIKKAPDSYAREEL